MRTDRQTDRQTDRRTDGRTATTKLILTFAKLRKCLTYDYVHVRNESLDRKLRVV